MKNLQKLSILLMLLFMIAFHANALTFTSQSNGAWHEPCRWAAVPCGTAPVVGVNVPGPNDQVVIFHDVTVNAATKTVYGTIQVAGVELEKSGSNVGQLIVTGAGVRLNIYQTLSGERCTLLLSDNANLVNIGTGAFVDIQGGVCVKTCDAGSDLISTSGGGNIRVTGCMDCGGGYTSTSSLLAGCALQNTFGSNLNFCVVCSRVCTGTAQSNIGGVAGCTAIVLLPVTFVAVSANYQEKTTSVSVNWATSVEVNNAKFEVQRSLDGLNYYTIGTITPQMANSTSTLYYKYLDKTLPKANTIYYRIKQTDIDGQYSYSKLVVAQRTNKIAYSNIYPNPSDDGNIFIHIEGDESAKMLVSYMTLQGKLLFREELSGVNGTTKFNAKENLSTGIYLVCIETENNVFYHKLQVVR